MALGAVDYAVPRGNPRRRAAGGRQNRAPAEQAKENLLRSDGWKPYEKGFEREGAWFVCNNGTDAKSRRGIVQNVDLNQVRPEPIVAVCHSKAEGVTGTADSRLLALPRSHLYRRHAALGAGGQLQCRHARLAAPPGGGAAGEAGEAGKLLHAATGPRRQGMVPRPGTLSDSSRQPVPASSTVCRSCPSGPAKEGFQIRDVAAESDFVGIERFGADASGGEVLSGTALDIEIARVAFPFYVRATEGPERNSSVVVSSDRPKRIGRSRWSTPFRWTPKGCTGLTIPARAAPRRTGPRIRKCDARFMRAPTADFLATR